MDTIKENSNENSRNIKNKIQNLTQEPSSKDNLDETLKKKDNKNPQPIKEQLSNEDIEYEKIKNSRFKQQRLPAWRPVPTILSIVIVFSFFGVAFIALGIILLLYSYKVKSQEIDYSDCKLNELCEKNITITEDIPQPVFVYYQLDGFFQNARRYVKSKEMDQLTGDKPELDENCYPVETNEEMGFKVSIDGNELNQEDVAIPCGLMAKTFFNDSFIFSFNGENIVDETNIAFERDKEIYNNSNISKQGINITDEHFIVWMRPSGLPNPLKLWGKIKKDLKKDDTISIIITNNYDVSYYEGKKKLILSNTTIFGGKNTFLAICYLVVGGLSLLCTIIFSIGYKIQMSKEKDS